MEAENVAVGVVAAGSGNAEIALGTVFGGSSFQVCVALGLAAVLFPLTVRLPRGVLVLLAATPVAGGATSRPARVVLLVAFAASMAYLVRASRRNHHRPAQLPRRADGHDHHPRAAIEAEEVIRQAVPSKQGRHDVAAGNLVGTLLNFVLFNLGVIAVATPSTCRHAC